MSNLTSRRHNSLIQTPNRANASILETRHLYLSGETKFAQFQRRKGLQRSTPRSRNIMLRDTTSCCVTHLCDVWSNTILRDTTWRCVKPSINSGTNFGESTNFKAALNDDNQIYYVGAFILSIISLFTCLCACV